ncbi:uncharacterized protein [Haliotis cracherodii]|uniref:uncharacterized protein isoform X1 n=1 Tax=Haliotis cracherodii TaxID=6455 RepID=UPI0039EC26F0
MMHTTWYRDGAIVLNSRKIENERCDKDKPSSIPHNNTYTDSYYDKYISGRVSVNCTYYQHNLTLTTELTVHDGSVWRCVDSRNRGSNNLTLDFPETSRTDQTLPSRPSTVQQLPLKSTQILEGSTQDISEATEESTTPLTDSATTITTDSDTHGSFVSGFPGTGYKTSSQLIDSTTTLAKLTSIKITTAPEIDNKDEAIYISVGAVVCVVLFIIIVICVCVVRKRRMGVVTEAHSDADNGAELTAAPTNATIKIHIDGRINSPDHRNQVQPGDKKEHLTNKTPEHLPALDSAVDVGDLFAVPDKTPEHLPALDGAVDDGDLFAVPDKTPEHLPALDGAVDVGDLFAVPDKIPENLPALDSAVDVGDLFAVPDKTPKHLPALDGAVDVGDLFAVNRTLPSSHFI